MTRAIEANFDGLVGPTHNYAGLSYGNVASTNNTGQVSRPKEAALQGLAKMKALSDLGVVQGVIPPQLRPNLNFLRELGIAGSDDEVIKKAAKVDPVLLSCAYSASSMWTANAATVAPSADTGDGRVHFTSANMNTNAHRAHEGIQAHQILKKIFNNDKYFVHHPPLPGGACFGDEGAANHIRFCDDYDSSGVQVFVYGKEALDINAIAPKKYPARQTKESCIALARLHKLDNAHTLFIQQNPDVIDQGVFHNDVISVGNLDTLFYHEMAFLNGDQDVEAIKNLYPKLKTVKIKTSEVSVEEAVKTYLFNTQLVRTGTGKIAIIAPYECKNSQVVSKVLNEIAEDKSGPIDEVYYFDVKQSMQNGGGPACLRLRVALTQEELAAVNPECLINNDKYQQLVSWVNKHYRDELTPEVLADVSFVDEVKTALNELESILNINGAYTF